MSHVLKLINKGSRTVPTTYKFGANEHLNIHATENYADLTDAVTGAYIRHIGWDGLRNMNYAPAKLLAGNTSDQLLNAPAKSLLAKCVKSSVKYLLGGFTLALVLSAVGNVTGCTDYLMSQVEQDIATSTTYKSTDLDQQRQEFTEQALYANKRIAEMNLYAAGGVK
ncbi:hypothetical protein [Psychrobacter sp. W2-37-MNA-CIBAN-0211]|uniref:hypothetical protein n=1 Tax=Psychrobacter sp. W2-37-MNA-CIBAN-0211 TaxID=3140443 RepID=UPI0033242356